MAVTRVRLVIDELVLDGVEPGDPLVHDSLARALAPALGEHGLEEAATEPWSAAVSAAGTGGERACLTSETAGTSRHASCSNGVRLRRHPGPDGECAACKARRLQRSATGAGPARGAADRARRAPVVRPAAPAVGREGDGRALVTTSRASRVHTDAPAAAVRRAVGALAYAVGQRHRLRHRAGYAPASPDGRALIAHELAHVVQQRDAGARPGRLPIAAEPARRSVRRRERLRFPPPARAVSLTDRHRPCQRITRPGHTSRIAAHARSRSRAPRLTLGRDAAGRRSRIGVVHGFDRQGLWRPRRSTGHVQPDSCSQRRDAAQGCAARTGKVDVSHVLRPRTLDGTPEPEAHGSSLGAIGVSLRRGVARPATADVRVRAIGHGCVRWTRTIEAHRRLLARRRRRARSSSTARAAPAACEPARRCGVECGGPDGERGYRRLAEAGRRSKALEGELDVRRPAWRPTSPAARGCSKARSSSSRRRAGPDEHHRVPVQPRPGHAARSAAAGRRAGDPRRTPATRSASSPPTETLQLAVELDAADQLEAANPLAIAIGPPPDARRARAAALPAVDGHHPRQGPRAARLGARSSPRSVPLVLLVWGPLRVIPVRVESVSITEEAFDQLLNPIRAKVDLGLRTLTAQGAEARRRRRSTRSRSSTRSPRRSLARDGRRSTSVAEIGGSLKLF